MQLSLISTDDLVLYLFSNKGMEVSNISTGKQVLVQRGCDGSVHLPPLPRLTTQILEKVQLTRFSSTGTEF